MAGRRQPARALGELRGGIRLRQGLSGGIVLLALAALLATAISLGTGDDGVDGGATPTLAEVVRDPGAYEDREIVVSGPVLQLVGRDGLLLGEERLLIVAPGLPAALRRSDVAQVVGRASRFDRADTEAQLGVDLPAMRWDGFEGGPVITASRVTVEDAAPALPRPTSPDQVVRDVTLRGSLVEFGARVTDRISPVAVVLDRTLLLVAPASALESAAVGRTVRVAGRVGTFRPGRVSRDLGLDVDQRSLISWVGHPYVTATSVEVRE